MPPISAPAITPPALVPRDGSDTCWRSTQQRCSGVPTTARTELTGTSMMRSDGRRR